MITIEYSTNGETSSMEARTVREAADVCFMVLTAQYGDANLARGDANSIERTLRQKASRDATLNSEKFRLSVRK